MTSPNGHVSVDGVVEGTNERGVKVDGEWLNLSKFRQLALPPVGARIHAEVDARGFLSSIDVLEPSATPAVSRDQTITRLAVLKAASHFLGLLSQSREEVRSEHVLVLADKWLAWVEEST